MVTTMGPESERRSRSVACSGDIVREGSRFKPSDCGRRSHKPTRAETPISVPETTRLVTTLNSAATVPQSQLPAESPPNVTIW